MISQRNNSVRRLPSRLAVLGMLLAVASLAGCADSFPKLPTFDTGSGQPLSTAQQNAELEELKKARAENAAKAEAKPPIVPASAPAPVAEPSE